MDPALQEYEDPIPFLQVFARRYRTGELAPKHKPVRGRTVEDALRGIGQAFAHVGAPDPRNNDRGQMDFRLARQLAAYKKQDPPPHRVKPVPAPILQFVLSNAYRTQDPAARCTADMITLAFFFLLRPGEYTGTKSESTPFRRCDVALFLGPRKLNLDDTSQDVLLGASFATLEFTTQKNGVKGEVIGLGRTGHPQFCPVLAIARRILHLRRHGAPPTTPIATYWAQTKWKPVKPKDITEAIRLAALFLGPSHGFLPQDISARSLRAAGAMALLCADVDSDRIRLIGRWRSDEMLRYLHVQAAPVMSRFSSLMLQHGDFHLIPNSQVPVPMH